MPETDDDTRLPVYAIDPDDVGDLSALIGTDETLRHTLILRSGEKLRGLVVGLLTDGQDGPVRWLAFEREVTSAADVEGVLVERIRLDAVDYIGRREPVTPVVVTVSGIPAGLVRIAPEDFTQALVGIRASALTGGVPSLPGEVVSIQRAVDGGGAEMGYWAVQIRHDGRDYYDEYVVPTTADAGLLVPA